MHVVERGHDPLLLHYFKHLAFHLIYGTATQLLNQVLVPDFRSSFSTCHLHFVVDEELVPPARRDKEPWIECEGGKCVWFCTDSPSPSLRVAHENVQCHLFDCCAGVGSGSRFQVPGGSLEPVRTGARFA